MLGEKLKQMGVVGAGGAGFPTSVKAAAEVEYVLANGAECEPLLHKDVELMKHYPAEIIAGMRRMMESTKARQGRFGIKAKNAEAVRAIEPEAKKHAIELSYLGDFYPSGDEFELVYTATGRLIPAGGIPLQVGCVVNNVETLYNVHQAGLGNPVTRKILSVAGAVARPGTFWAPIGTPFREVLKLAGGVTAPDFGMFVGGIMMGALSFDLDEVVTKTTAGLIVLPRAHYLVARRAQPAPVMARIGKSACDQCSYCTEFCPRYLLGYEVQPHKVMRSLGFTASGSLNWSQWGELCCACGLCTLYACPEDLFPKEACDQAKQDRRAAGLKLAPAGPARVHPLKEERRVPLAMLRRRLKVEEYDVETPLEAAECAPEVVRLKLAQHVGKPAVPVVKAGARVRRGEAVARVGAQDLGADLHASIDGTVTGVTDNFIEVRNG
jgi:Na+-translocating ferredoxin:NAD+ oxidoreductase RnfC subunit